MSKEYRNHKGLHQLHRVLSEMFYGMIEVDCIEMHNHIGYHLLKLKLPLITIKKRGFQKKLTKYLKRFDEQQKRKKAFMISHHSRYRQQYNEIEKQIDRCGVWIDQYHKHISRLNRQRIDHEIYMAMHAFTKRHSNNF
jgi:hypothetical protein